MKTTRVLIADDHEIVRMGVIQILSTHPEFEIVAEADTGVAAVAEAERLKPDVAVMDIMMPQLNGLEATRQITKQVPGVSVLVLSMYHSENLIREVLASGARGYVLKSDAGRDLISGMVALSQGRPFFTSSVSDVIMNGFLGTGKSRRAGAESGESAILTTRERQIVQLLAEGHTNKEIAQRLSISVATAESHRGHIMNKLRLNSVSGLVRYAIRNEIVAA